MTTPHPPPTIPLQSAVPIPPSLRDTLKILLEEELYIPGINLLNSLLAQGINGTIRDATTTPPPPTRPSAVHTPPPIYFTLLTTILTHPQFTTHLPRRASLVDRDLALLPSSSERLLYRYLDAVGAHGCNLSDAWRFVAAGTGRRRQEGDGGASSGGGGGGGSGGSGGSGGGGKGRNDGSEVFEDDKLDLGLARNEGVFGRDEDFWAIVGWSFTCACACTCLYGTTPGKVSKQEKRMRARWDKAWKRWLEVMIEGLERDWIEHGRNGNQVGNGGATYGVEGKNNIKEALIVRYFPDSIGSAGIRRVMRAVFANGKGRMGGEWKGVWPGETESLKSQGSKENNGFESLMEDNAHNLDDDSSSQEWETLEGETISVRDTQGLEESPNPVDLWGGIQAVILRRRLMLLLLDVCTHTSLSNAIGIFQEALAENVLALPIPEFELFTRDLYAPVIHSSLLLSETQQTIRARILGVSLNICLLDQLMESAAPIPKIFEEYGPTMEEVVRCYLRWGARSGKLTDNVKVSILIEGVLRGYLILAAGNQRPIGGGSKQEVTEALEDGIRRRRGKGTGKGKQKGTVDVERAGGKKRKEESLVGPWLEELEERLRVCVMVGWDGIVE